MTGSIRSSNSTTRTESPAGRMRKSVFTAPRALAARATLGRRLLRGRSRDWRQPPKRLQDPPVDAAKATIGHQDHKVALAMLADENLDDVIEGLDVSGRLPTIAEVSRELPDGQSFRFGQRRSKDRRDEHLVGRRERARKVILKDAPARRCRAGLEDRPDSRLGV